MRESEPARKLRVQIERLLESQRDDARLRDNLEGLAHDTALPGLTWFWGPALYERNRVMFRPFIQAHFANWATDGRKWQRVLWSDHAPRLDAWLDNARRYRDTQLVRRLLSWRLAGKNWGLDDAACRAEVLAAYQAAAGPAARAVTLDEYAIQFELDEATALALYQTDRASKPFILGRLTQSFWSGGDKRKLWTRLLAAAESAGDDEFRFTLYRKQVPLKQWQAEVFALAKHVADSDELCSELTKRHPEGWGLDLSTTALDLLKQRRRDVMPYIRDQLEHFVGGWNTRRSDAFVKLAKFHGWWDLWAAAIRTPGSQKLFNDAVSELLGDSEIAEAERITRLRALAGVSREWNWPGFGLAVIHTLDDYWAAKLYNRYPELIHGPFRPHVLPTWWQGYPLLLAAAQAREDETLIDLLASRYVTRPRNAYWAAGATAAMAATVDQLCDYYQIIREHDPVTFARRAAETLTRIPAFSIYNYAQTLEGNKLARLFFVRSFDAYLAAPASVADLVEGSEIHVQMLAYNILARDDDRARKLAVEHLPILAGTFLRPLHRKTRLAAFRALENAARADLEAAKFVLRRAREALRLPDRKYPKEELTGLIGRVLHHQPELCGPRERPVIYRREAVR